MANITRFNPVGPIEDMFDELTRGFFVRPLSLPRQAERCSTASAATAW